jgi:ArsR family transcriptional regulator
MSLVIARTKPSVLFHILLPGFSFFYWPSTFFIFQEIRVGKSCGKEKYFIECIRLSEYIGFMKTTAQIFKALSDEIRLRIISLLVNGQELCVCDIMAALDLPQSTVSRHLACLRNTGLVNGRRQGPWMYYKMSKERIAHAETLFDLLGAMLFDHDQTTRDQIMLKEHLATKDKTKCS